MGKRAADLAKHAVKRTRRGEIKLPPPPSVRVEPGTPAQSSFAPVNNRSSRRVPFPGAVATNHHHDLETFHKYSKKFEISKETTVFKGVEYEYMTQHALRKFGFSLRRVGGKDDQGVDLVGLWTVPKAMSLQELEAMQERERLAGEMNGEDEGEVEGVVDRMDQRAMEDMEEEAFEEDIEEEETAEAEGTKEPDEAGEPTTIEEQLDLKQRASEASWEAYQSQHGITAPAAREADELEEGVNPDEGKLRGDSTDAFMETIQPWLRDRHKDNLARSLRVILQCKRTAHKRPVGPMHVRELEGAFAAAPIGWRKGPVMAVMVSNRSATQGLRDALVRSRSPMGYMWVDERRKVLKQFVWNSAADAGPLVGVTVGLKRVGHGRGACLEAVLLKNGMPCPEVDGGDADGVMEDLRAAWNWEVHRGLQRKNVTSYPGCCEG